MLFFVFSAAMAQSITCSPDASHDADLCDVVTEAAAYLNSDGLVIDDASPKASLRPATLYARLEALRDEALSQTDGCRSDGTWTAWIAGDFRNGAGSWDGVTNGGSDPASGFFDAGVFGGQAYAGAVGDEVGALGGGKIVANLGEQFAAGIYVRVSGRTGLFIGLEGTCDAQPATEGFDAWYPRAMPSAGCVEMTFDFDDGTLQGWTTSDALGGTGVLGLHSGGTGPHQGSSYLRHAVWNTRDQSHTTSFATSPSFVLHPDHEIEVYLNGGENSGPDTDTDLPPSQDDLPELTATSGTYQLQGVALQVTATGDYLAHESKTNNGDAFESHVFSPTEVAANAGTRVQLQYYDAYEQSWGWMGIDTISIRCD